MTESTRTGGIGFFSALFLLFLALRLTDQIDWAWYWVAAPLWGPLGLIVAIIGVLFVVGVIGGAFSSVANVIHRRRRLDRQYRQMRAHQEQEARKADRS